MQLCGKCLVALLLAAMLSRCDAFSGSLSNNLCAASAVSASGSFAASTARHSNTRCGFPTIMMDDAQALIDAFLQDGGAITEDSSIVTQSQLSDMDRACDEESQLANIPGISLAESGHEARDLSSVGVIRLGGCLSDSTASELRAHILSELLLSCDDEDDGDDDSSLSAVLSPHGTFTEERRRWDLRLRLSPLVRRALQELLSGGVGDALQSRSGSDAILYELAALVVAPGAAPQPLHADALFNDDGCLFTAFVALQEVSRSMGPTRFILGTHTEEAHAAFDQGKDDGSFLGALPEGASVACGLLRTGDATVYDGRLLHGGSASSSSDEGAGDDDGVSERGAEALLSDEKVRVLFYVTVHRADADPEELANDEAHSLLEGYRGRFTLGQLRAPDFDWAAAGEE